MTASQHARADRLRASAGRAAIVAMTAAGSFGLVALLTLFFIHLTPMLYHQIAIVSGASLVAAGLKTAQTARAVYGAGRPRALPKSAWM